MDNIRRKTAAQLRSELAANDDVAYRTLAALFDEGTFAELGAFVKRASSGLDGADSDSESSFEPVITGYGAVNGALVFAFAQDFSRCKGALSPAAAEKICNLYALALKSKAPIVGVFNSAGAPILDGTEALAGYGRIMKCASSASGIIPQIAVIDGVCAGSAAIIAGMFDFTIATEKSKLFVNSPFLLKAGKSDANVGSADFAEKNGLISIKTGDIPSAINAASALISLLPSSSDSTAEKLEADDLNRELSLDGIISNDSYDAREVISTLADSGAFLELNRGCAPELIVGLCRIGGSTCAVAASNPAVNGGRLSAAAARKAAKLVKFAGSFALPTLTLVDSEGLDISIDSEKAPYSDALSELAGAYAASKSVKLAVVINKAYGAAYTLLGSKSVGADITFALEGAAISAMAPESAVEFSLSEKINASKDPKALRASLTEEWKATIASPTAAAKCGAIDDIIPASELRMRVIYAFEMLAAGNGGF